MNLFKIFDATRKQKEQIKAWAAKAGMDGEAIISKVESAFDKDAEQFAAARWIIKGYDTSTFKQALYICGQKKIDPMGVDPEELVQKNPDIKPKERAINPDDVLTDRKDEGDGVVTYAARYEDREVLRQIINTHYGKDASPWCLLAGDGNGNLSYESKGYWRSYDAYPKRVAFRNGKLLAFSAGSDPDVREWWDRMDRSFPFIPYDGKTWEGKDGNTYSIKGGDVMVENKYNKSFRGRLSREYSDNIEMSDREVYVRGDKLYDDGNDTIYDIVREDDKYYYVECDAYDGVARGQYSKDALTREGLIEDYYDNGQLHQKCIYKNGKKDGLYESYHENGKLSMKRAYKDGEYNGLYERYYDNGQLNEKCAYKDGEKEGLYECYYRNGQLGIKCTFKDGEYNGLYEKYYDNGQLNERCTFKDSEKDGLYECYYRNGQLGIKCTYKNGEYNGLCEKYYDNGKLKERCTFKDGNLVGLTELYNAEGELVRRDEY